MLLSTSFHDQGASQKRGKASQPTTHMYTHTCMQHTLKCACTSTLTHPRSTLIHTHMHILTHTHTCTHETHLHTHRRTHMLAHHTHVPTHTGAHTCMPTHECTQTHTQNSCCWLPSLLLTPAPLCLGWGESTARRDVPAGQWRWAGQRQAPSEAGLRDEEEGLLSGPPPPQTSITPSQLRTS